jgi:hypothetical protein
LRFTILLETLCGKQFDRYFSPEKRCDSDENYIPKVQKQTIALPGDTALGGKHTRTMNSPHAVMANTLFNATEN